MMAYPDLCKSFKIYPGVDEKVFKGANLMWPGVDKDQEITEFDSDDVRGIVDANGK